MNWYVCILWNCYHNKVSLCITLGFPGGSDGEESACSVEDQCLIPELGRSPGGGHGNALQCSCRRIPMDRGSWWATVHGVAKSWTWQSMHAQDHGQFWEVVEKSIESFCFHVWWWVWSHSGSAEPEVREQSLTWGKGAWRQTGTFKNKLWQTGTRVCLTTYNLEIQVSWKRRHVPLSCTYS